MFECAKSQCLCIFSVVYKLKQHFARQGIPHILMTDNGPQLSSENWTQLSKTWEFQHVTLSPGYPQSNGTAENAVKTVKHLMIKALTAI
jgi:transposase InsO family protein